MSAQVEYESTVLGGLPVLVKASIYPAEPDIGIFGPQVEIDEICWTSGKPLPRMVDDRIGLKDIYRLQSAALEGDIE